jgi:Fe2+ transport system protein FeoA
MSTIQLSDISLPGMFRCTNIDCVGDAAVQLKRLGVCDGRAIEVMQLGDPMVLRVVGARIGVSRLLAKTVRVEPSPQAVAVTAAIGADVRTGETTVIGMTSSFTDSEVVSHV